MTLCGSLSTTLHNKHPLFRYLNKMNIVVPGILLIVFLLIVFFGNWYLKANKPKQPNIVSSSELLEKTEGTYYVGYIYDQRGKKLADIKGYGTNVKYINNSADPSLNNHISIKVGTNRIETNRNILITQPKSIKRVYPVKDIKKQIKDIPNIYSERVLILETRGGSPILAYYGYNISLKFSDIPNTSIFLVDGHYVFISNGGYTLIDANLLK